jgi:hypothetical protein
VKDLPLSEAKKAHKPKDAIIAAKKYNGPRCSDRPDIYGTSPYSKLKRTRRTKLGTYTLFAGIVFLVVSTLTVLAATLYSDHPWLAGLTR